jgi:hypothetical protein
MRTKLGHRLTHDVGPSLEVAQRELHHRSAGIAGQQASVVGERHEGADWRGGLVPAVGHMEYLQ